MNFTWGGALPAALGVSEKLMDAFWKALAAGFAAIIVAVVTIFSDKIVGRIKLALNRADLRVKQFEEMALDLSDYVFQAELQHEFLVEGWDTPAGLEPITNDYNSAITTLRRKEFVYRSWVRKYWRSPSRGEFDALMLTVKNVDKAVHALNSPEGLPQKLETLKKLNEELRSQVEAWLSKADA